MTKILVCDPELDFAQAIAQYALSLDGSEVRHATSTSLLSTATAGSVSCVIVLGPGVPVDEALEWADRKKDSDAHHSIIVVAPNATTEVMRTAMRAGVDDLIDSAAVETEMLPALKEAQKRVADRVLARTPSEPVPPKRAKVITVFSTKGGVGKTVIATNLGVALAAMSKSVVLVDLDLQFGDVAIMLGLEPNKTILGVVQASDRMDDELMHGYLTDHPSGLKVLLAPVRPEDAESITASRITRIVTTLASMFEYVIIDTAAALDDTVLTALDASAKVIAVTMMDVASVKNTRISLQKLKQLGYNGSHVEVLLNRADSKVFLQPDEVEKAIGSEIRYRYPSDQLVPRSVNKGCPLVMEAPKCAVAKAMLETARSLVAVSEVPAHVS